VGWSPDEVEFVKLPNSSSRTLAMGSTQPQTEIIIIIIIIT
jgi:hypothetical protein